ncbi:unnamed protein product [Schistocephalus solidus]|uniref:Uncharacterized protein n=1 Tax=Schistocephalus solidus TaxID=70667 RepID=A0A183SAV6_SCHSO|nr:unnamed protein product [Schistocephalus solidus]
MRKVSFQTTWTKTKTSVTSTTLTTRGKQRRLELRKMEGTGRLRVPKSVRKTAHPVPMTPMWTLVRPAKMLMTRMEKKKKKRMIFR